MLRLIFWMPQVLHTFFGISRVRFWTHFWGSAAGYVLPLLAVSYFGPKAFDAMRAAPPSVWVGLAVATVAIAAATWTIRRRRAAVLAGALALKPGGEDGSGDGSGAPRS